MIPDTMDILFAETGIYKGDLSTSFIDVATAASPGMTQTVAQPFLAGLNLADIDDAHTGPTPEEREQAQIERDLLRSQGDQSEGLAAANGRQKRGGAATERARSGNHDSEKEARDGFARMAERVRVELERLEQLYKEIALLEQEIAGLEADQRLARDASDDAFERAHEAQDIRGRLAAGTATPDDMTRIRNLLGDQADGKTDEQLMKMLDDYIIFQMRIGRDADARDRELQERINRRRAELRRRQEEARLLEEKIRADGLEYGESPEMIDALMQQRKEAAREAVEADVVSAERGAALTDDGQFDTEITNRETSNRDNHAETVSSISDDDFVLPAIPSPGPG